MEAALSAVLPSPLPKAAGATNASAPPAAVTDPVVVADGKTEVLAVATLVVGAASINYVDVKRLKNELASGQ